MFVNKEAASYYKERGLSWGCLLTKKALSYSYCLRSSECTGRGSEYPSSYTVTRPRLALHVQSRIHVHVDRVLITKLLASNAHLDIVDKVQAENGNLRINHLPH